MIDDSQSTTQSAIETTDALVELEQSRIQSAKRGIFGFFVTHIRFTWLVLTFIVVAGVFALVTIPREADPEVKIPIAVVTTVYPGASPQDVEDLITDKVEKEIEELDEVKRVTSSSGNGISSVVVEFNAEADLEKSIRELKDKVLEVRGLPNDVEDPVVTQIRTEDTPIITFSLGGDLTDEQLKQLGEFLELELEKIPGVSDIVLIGAREREFAVTIDRGTLERLTIPVTQVVGAIASSNIDTPLGAITIDKLDYNIRAVSKFATLEQLRNVVIGSVDGRSILLRDIATVEDQLAEVKTLSRISIAGSEPVNTVSLQLFKKTGGNILNIVDSAKERLAVAQHDGVIPDSVTVEVSSDYSQFIRNDLRTLGLSGIQSGILIFIVMLLALSFREAIISLLAIPLTFFITFFILNFFGYTLNSLSLFTLVLSLGLLVDAFIVVLEGVFHNLRAGYSPADASLLSIAHYKMPLIAGVLTTVSAFVPMLLVSGILGEFLKVLPITISITLLSSLFVSLALVPALTSIFLKKSAGSVPKISTLERYVTDRLRARYRVAVKKFLANRKRKWQFAIATLSLFIISFGLLVSGFVPVQLFPNVDIDFTFVDVEMPVGTDLAATDEVVRQVENYLIGRPDVKSFVTSVGQSSSFGFSERGSTTEHVASVNVNFVDESERDKKSYEIVEEMREDLKAIPQGKVTLQEISSGPPTGAPIEARITGHDLDVLNEMTADVIARLEATEGVIDVSSNRQVTPADLTFTLNQVALASSGLTVGEVSSYLRTAIFGVTATSISLEGDDIDVVVKLNKDRLSSVEEIENLSIVGSRGQLVKLSRVATFSLRPSLASINHRDFERTITVQAYVEPGYTASQIVPEVEKALASTPPAEGYSVTFGGEVEDIEQSFSELWAAMSIALILILSILVLQFDSFRRPFAILMALPLTLIGIVIGMMIFNLPFSFSVFLGLISLAGVAVNDGIILIDKASRNLAEKNMNMIDALADAGDTRLQPILLTSITTIIGVAPLAFADEFWLGLSIAMIFGLASATILQLFVVPMIFLKLEGKGWLKRQRKSVNV